MSNTASLPQDIIHDILLQLPAKFLAQSRCVSRPCHTLISDPHYMKTYLKQDNHQKLILVSPPNSLYTIDLSKNQIYNIENEAAIKLKFEHPNHWLQVLGSCNGLLLLVDEGDTIILLNPTTSEFKKLLENTRALPNHRTIHGIGYDSCIDDYKIVTITFHDDETLVHNDDHANCPEMLVHVYTMKQNCWKQVQNSPFNHSDSWPCSGIFLNGSVHWLATTPWNHKWVIAAFDIDKEMFWQIPIPDVYADEKGQIDTARLTVLGGCLSLCLYVYHVNLDGKQTYIWDIWLMKEHGNTKSWTKFSIKEPLNMFYTIRPICLLAGHELLMESDGRKLVVYNLEDDSFRDIVVCGLPETFRDHVICFESLVTPSCI